MALVPFSYNVRSLFVRRTSTLLTVLGIGATVAVMSGVLALQSGFTALFGGQGSDDIAVFLRQGCTNEGDSAFTRERSEILTKSFDEAQKNASGALMITPEMYSAARLFKISGGETNVPVRGVRPMSFEIHAATLHVNEGRVFKPGSDEIVVGRKVAERIRDCHVDDIVQINMTPFRVVGIFDNAGSYASEIWGDLDRFCEAMERPVFNRVIARLPPGTEIGFTDADGPDGKPVLTGIAERMDKDVQVPSKVMSERQYLAAQTGFLGFVLIGLGAFLGLIMGIAAVFTATNTMLAAIASRSHEIGILLSLGFRPWAIFLSFMFESRLHGLLGGLAGALMVLPINGIETGTMNWNTFTEVAFAFRVTPLVLGVAVSFSLMLGLLGGMWPALRAAMMRPTQALRRA
jgi:ABC-type antimicrobial peptide transport system permease subunit